MAMAGPHAAWGRTGLAWGRMGLALGWHGAAWGWTCRTPSVAPATELPSPHSTTDYCHWQCLTAAYHRHRHRQCATVPAPAQLEATFMLLNSPQSLSTYKIGIAFSFCFINVSVIW
jgi:hypothetical protein